MMQLKLEIHAACVHMLQDKINILQATLIDLQAGAENDAKSSAGDKHETARAMMQIEHEQISKQLSALLMQKNLLEQLHPKNETKSAVLGSLILTDKGYFYLSIALGRVQVNEHSVIALSPQSPLGAKWLGKKEGDSATMNSIQYHVQMVS
jgi:hypothetical protein